jgi:hypothetical protein
MMTLGLAFELIIEAGLGLLKVKLKSLQCGLRTGLFGQFEVKGPELFSFGFGHKAA